MPIISINGNLDSTTPVGVSALGTIVFDNVVFPGGSWIDLEGNEQFFNDVKLDAVALRVNRSKVIIKSNVSGKTGTNKEYITTDDYIVNLDAILAPETFSPLDLGQIGVSNLIPLSGFVSGNVGFTIPDEPSELLSNIAILDDVQDSVEVRCKFLQNYFRITKVLIESIDISKASADTYVLKMVMSSDNGISLGDFG